MLALKMEVGGGDEVEINEGLRIGLVVSGAKFQFLSDLLFWKLIV